MEKEKLPGTFLASFISDGWQTVSLIQDNITSIKEAFSDTEKVIPVLQDLLDAYLVCIGQLQAQINDKVDSEIGVDVAVGTPAEITKDLSAEAGAPEEPIEADPADVAIEEAPVEEKAAIIEVEPVVEEPVEIAKVEDKKVEEPFEYFCDFDECPVEDEEADERVRADLHTRFTR